MEIKTDEKLESTGYRCLFEGVKKEGVEPFLSFTQDMQKMTKKMSIFEYLATDCLSILESEYCDIVKYIREHQKEFRGFSFRNVNVLDVLNNLERDIILLDCYLENVRRLEELKVSDIFFLEKHISEGKFIPSDQFHCKVRQNNFGEIIYVKKYYTDVEAKVMETKIQQNNILLLIQTGKLYSFMLEVENCEDYRQNRRIFIRNFDFDRTKLPTEEELQSYEIPKQYCLK